MSVSQLLKAVGKDVQGAEVALKVIGTREPPPRMVVQIAIVGTASVQIQGRIARDAPWQNLGPTHSAGSLLHLEPVQFLRAIASGVAAGTTVTVWAVWAW
jgi:hypothetical protein